MKYCFLKRYETAPVTLVEVEPGSEKFNDKGEIETFNIQRVLFNKDDTMVFQTINKNGVNKIFWNIFNKKSKKLISSTFYDYMVTSRYDKFMEFDSDEDALLYYEVEYEF